MIIQASWHSCQTVFRRLTDKKSTRFWVPLINRMASLLFQYRIFHRQEIHMDPVIRCLARTRRI